MEVSGKTQRYNLPVQNASVGDARSKAPKATRTAGGDDTVDLSAHGHLIRQATERARQLPDVRADRVAALRQRIESGAYRIKGENVAAGLLSEAYQNNDILKKIIVDG